MLDRYSRHFWRIGVASMTVLLLSGCSVMDVGKNSSLPLPESAALAPSPAATITMEIRAAGKKPEMTQVQLENGVTVQQMLEKMKLVKRFRRMNIEVMRVTDQQRAKLDVKYDHSKAHVNPLYDYALYPGDHLIVAEDTSTAIDDMFRSLSKSFGGAGGSR